MISLSNFDLLILVFFLVLTIVIGFKHNVKSLSDFAVGDRKFSNFTQVATIVATSMGGNTFNGIMSITYSEGLFFLLAISGETISLAILAIFFIPKMRDIINNNSVAEAIGNIYGNYSRLFVALLSSISMIGALSIQFRMFGKMFEYIGNFDKTVSVILSSTLVTLYSSKGGIRSVTYTDIVQFLAFAIAVPIITISLWKNINISHITLAETEKFNISSVLSFQNPKIWDFVFMVLFFATPGIGADVYQRILLGSDLNNIQKNFIVAGIIFFVLRVIIALVPILVYLLNPNLEASNIIVELITQYAQSGIRGLIILGIISMVMSTADSKMNTASVLIVNDCFLFIKKLTERNQVLIAKFINLIIGVIATLLAFSEQSLLDIAISSQSFYMSSVTPLLMVTILGFRTKKILFNIVLFLGFSFQIFYLIVNHTINYPPKWIMISLVSNALIFLALHYCYIILRIILLKKVKIVTHKRKFLINLINYVRYVFDAVQKEKSLGWIANTKDNLLKSRVKKTSIYTACKKYWHNTKISEIFLVFVPSSSKTYTLSALYFISTLVLNIYSQHYVINIFPNKMMLLYEVIVILSLSLISYHAFSNSLFKDKIFSVIWIISNFFILFFVSILFLLITNFQYIQLTIFFINIFLAFQLIRVRTTIVFLILATFCSIEFYKLFFMQYYDNNIIFPSNSLYAFFFIALMIIFFNIPSEDKVLVLRNILIDTKKNLLEKSKFLNQTLAKLNLNEQKSEQLIEELSLRNLEIKNLQNIKTEFVNNLQHETRTPITGIVSMAEALYDAYHQLNEEERQQYIVDIAHNAKKLISFIDNMIDLSKLSSLKYELKLEKISLKSLIFRHIDMCTKLHYSSKEDVPQEFIFDLDNEENITIECDRYYIGQLLNNIIKNALTYSDSGYILIKCKKLSHNLVELSCRDEGVGIPENELYDIFGTFIVSSNTKTSSGGRGVGLSLCKKIVNSHNGEIWISSNNPSKGVTCFIHLPIRHLEEK